MANYPRIPLGELAADEPGAVAIGPFGSRMKSSVYVDEGVPVIRGTNISAERHLKGAWVYVTEEFAEGLPNCLVRSGDLVFPHRGSIGQVALIGAECKKLVLSTSMMKFRADADRVNSEFLYYFFRSSMGREEILSYSSQVGTPGIGQPLSSLRRFRVPLPSLETQNAIAAILGALDEKIELNRQTSYSLEVLARAIFKSWFVDFDPVHAKAKGRDTGLAPDLANLFPDRFGDDGLPEGWQQQPLEAQFDLSPRTPVNDESTLPYVDMAALPTNSARVMSVAERPRSGGARFINGDALLARITPCLENGKAAFVDFLAEDEVAIGSTEFIVFRPKGRLSGVWAYLLLRDDSFRSHAIANMSGTSGRQRVSASSLAPWPIAVPQMDVAQHFDAMTKPIFESMKAHDLESQTLAALRDLLLPKLMSGEIRIKDAEKLAGEAGV
ncbi:MAG: restriction endonuclease subunit S [Pseudomonadota bacterium]